MKHTKHTHTRRSGRKVYLATSATFVYLTPDEALEIASNLTAAAHEPNGAETCERCAQWAEDARRTLTEECAPDERHCSCVPHLRAAIARLLE